MNRLLILSFLCISFLYGCTKLESSNTETPEVQMDDRKDKVLMAIFSHPDDESTIAPILARYAREGVKVHLVIATDGRLGVNDFSGLEAGEGLVAIRKDEMKCSAEKLGVELIHLDYHDQLRAGEGYDGHMPHAQSLIKEIHQLITDLKPDALITWGPDGGTNHMDHRLVGASVTSVFLSQKWENPTALYYYGTPASKVENPEAKILRGVHDDYMNTQISYSDEDYEKAVASMKCHKSQFQIEYIEKRMKERKQDNKVFLRKFVSPQKQLQDIF